MHTRSVSRHALSALVTGLVLALGLVLMPSQVRAQDMTEAPHPAHIHLGTCAELGDVVHPLADVSAAAGTPVASDDVATPAAGEMEGHDMGSPAADSAMGSPAADSAMGSPAADTAGDPFNVGAETSETIVEAALADIIAGGHAVNVHESAENIGNYIACGDIAGTADESGDLTIELGPLNDSDHTGTATLHDNGDVTTTVTITLMHGEM